MSSKRSSSNPFDNLVLGDGTELTVLYEDRSILAIDKPGGWMFVPLGWSKTDKNLQLALESSLREAPHWVRKRNLRYIRYVHRLDAETTGVVLFAKSQGALETYSKMFEQRKVEKRYLVVVEGVPPFEKWRCELPLGSSRGPRTPVEVDHSESGRPAVTDFMVMKRSNSRVLLVARPITGRTHQIRVHLAQYKLGILGDPLYANLVYLKPNSRENEIALRSVGVSYRDPFTGNQVRIEAPLDGFLGKYGFSGQVKLGDLFLNGHSVSKPSNLKSSVALDESSQGPGDKAIPNNSLDP